MTAISSQPSEYSRAFVNAMDADGMTPLLRALEKKLFSDPKVNEELVDYLLLQKADPRLADKEGNTALHKAQMVSPLSVARKFMKLPGVNCDAQNLRGETPFFAAVRSGNVNLMKELVLHRANPSIRNQDGETALHVAVAENFLSNMHALIYAKEDQRQHGEALLRELLDLMPKKDRDITNKRGETAYVYAILHKNHAAEKILRLYGADIGYAQELLLRRQLAHVWNIGGTSELTLKERGKQQFTLEGFSQIYLFPSFLQHVDSFFKSKISDIQTLKPHFETLRQALTTSLPNSRQMLTHIVTGICSKKPCVIFGGTYGHAMSMVVNLRHNLLLIGNRDEKATRSPGIQVYRLPDAAVTGEMINKLQTLYINIEDFEQMIDKLNLAHIAKIQLPTQEVGNCARIAQELAFLMLTSCELWDQMNGQEIAISIYNKFLAHSCDEELKRYLQNSRNIDRSLLRKIALQVEKAPHFQASQKLKIGNEIKRVLKDPEIQDVVVALSKL